jgi:predicted permease
MSFMDTLRQDLGYALRGLFRRPGFTLVVMVTLAVGIGANTAIFSVVNAVLLKDPPFRDPDRLVRIYTRVPGFSEYGSTNYVDHLEMGALEGVFEDVGAYDAFFTQAEINREGRRVIGESLSQNLFSILGLDAAVGRAFLPEEDDTPGSHAVVMLGHGFWQRQFGGDPQVMGSTIRLAGRPFTVVGVMPRWLPSLSNPGLQTDVFVPVTMASAAVGDADTSPYTSYRSRRLSVVARLEEGVGEETASAGLEVLGSRLREARPDLNEDRSYHLLSASAVAIAPEIDGALRSVAVLLMTAVGLVLLLSCANLASFLLARATGRRREIAMRLALGASRWRLVRQLLTETLLMALLGGAAGLLLATWALGALVRFQPALPVSVTLDLGIDGTVFFFAFLISVVAGVMFGLAPALQSTNPDVTPALKDESGGASGGRLTLRNVLIAFQMCVSVVLLVGGGLFLRSLGAASSADVGFTNREAGVIWLDLAVGGRDQAERDAIAGELAARTLAVPGIDEVTLSSDLPLFLSSSFDVFRTPPGADPGGDEEGRRILIERVDHRFFEMMGIPVLSGRTFRESDRRDAPLVAVVNETAARTFWPTENPLGQELFTVGGEQGYEVVGVVGDTKIQRIGEPQTPLVYYAFAQRQGSDLYVQARGTMSPVEIVASLRRVVREADPSLVVMDAKTWDEQLSVMLFPGRMAALLLGVFGLLALSLASIGLYGVVSFAVSRQVQEVGIRMSLGASRGAVIRLVLRGVMGVVAVGGITGLAAAAGLARLMGSFLYGVGPNDPLTLVAVPLVLATVAALAAFVPARRASRVDPVRALRSE